MRLTKWTTANLSKELFKEGSVTVELEGCPLQELLPNNLFKQVLLIIRPTEGIYWWKASDRIS